MTLRRPNVLTCALCLLRRSALRYAEHAVSKCVGITIETRPDYCYEEHISDMLAYGAPLSPARPRYIARLALLTHPIGRF